MAGVICAFVIAEFYLRAVSKKHYLFRPNLQYSLHLNGTELNGVEGVNRFVVNAMGYRGQPLDEHADVRILAVGGSTTECFFLDEKEVWTAILENRLDSMGISSSIGNWGKSGLNIQHHIAQVSKIEPSEAHYVLCMVGVNDLLRFLKYHRAFKPLSANEVEATAYFQEKADTGFSFKVFDALQGELDLHYPSDTAVLHNPAEGILSFRNYRKNTSGKMLDRVDGFEVCLNYYSEQLRRFISTCKSKEVEPIFITQPSLWRANMSVKEVGWLWLDAQGDFMQPNQNYHSVELLDSLLGKINGVTKELARSHQLQCIELDELLPKDSSYYYDGIHFNEKGSEAVASILFHKTTHSFE